MGCAVPHSAVVAHCVNMKDVELEQDLISCAKEFCEEPYGIVKWLLTHTRFTDDRNIACLLHDFRDDVSRCAYWLQTSCQNGNHFLGIEMQMLVRALLKFRTLRCSKGHESHYKYMLL